MNGDRFRDILASNAQAFHEGARIMQTARPFVPLKHRAEDLLAQMSRWSDSDFALIASGDDGETLKARIEGVISGLLDRLDK